MKKISLKRREEVGRRLKQFLVNRIFAQFQIAVLCIDQFGLCGGLIMGSFMLTSFLLHAARAVVEKGMV
jgi:hypothetical protein